MEIKVNDIFYDIKRKEYIYIANIGIFYFCLFLRAIVTGF